jgi:hypothetical protein
LFADSNPTIMPLQWEELEREMEILQARMTVVSDDLDRLMAAREELGLTAESEDETGYYSDSSTEEEAPSMLHEPIRPWGQSSQWDPEFTADHDDEDIMVIDGGSYPVIEPARLNFQILRGDDEETVVMEDLASFNRARIYEDGECSDTETVVEDYNDGYSYTKDFVESLWN